jgi:hypothetical protein
MIRQTQGIFVPALVGGAVAGLLTALPFLSCFCCLWIIGGAMLAAHLLAKRSATSLTPGDGAIVGIFAGIVAAVVEAFVSLPFDAMNREFFQKFMDQFSQYFEELPEGWESFLNRAGAGTSLALFMLGLLISAVVFAALGALGGVIGASLFGRKTPGSPPGVGIAAPQDPGDRQP